MPKVFISYVHEDYDAVSRLAAHLERCEIDTWIDKKELAPGARWRDEIRRAIVSGDFFVACFSKNHAARTRGYVNEELTLAIDELRLRPSNKSWFIPVALDESPIPDLSINARESIKDLQRVSLSEDWLDGLHRLVLAINPNYTSPHIEPTSAQLRDFTDFRKGGLRALLERAEDMGYIIVSEIDMKDFLLQMLVPRLPESKQRDSLETQLNDEYRSATDEPCRLFVTIKSPTQMNRWIKSQTRALTHACDALNIPEECIPVLTQADIDEQKRLIRSGSDPIVEYYREGIGILTGIIGKQLQMPWWRAMGVLLRQEKISYSLFKLVKRMAYIVVHVEGNSEVSQGINPEHVVTFNRIAISVSMSILHSVKH